MMRHWKMVFAAPVLLLLASCGEEAPKPDKRSSEAKSLESGHYEATVKVISLVSTDKTTPATKLKVGDATTASGCVGADGVPPPALFVDDAADVCKTGSSYVSGAILNLALTCTRKKNPGYVTSAIDGAFTANSFTAKVTTGTSFSATGDYKLVRELTAKRTGTCPPDIAKSKV